MPAQLSTILYLSEYKEKTSSGYFIVNAVGYTRLEEEGDGVQKYIITAFYPIDDSKPCYLPQMMEGQVFSILNISPEDLPAHQITVVGVAVATGSATNNESGVQVDCMISDYLSKEKLIELPVILFHPSESRFTNQTTTIKRGSTIFFSGSLTFVENKLYIELHNFSFINNQQTFTRNPSSSPMPWSLKKPTIPATIKTSKKLIDSTITEQESDKFALTIPKSLTIPKTPTIPNTPTLKASTPKTLTIPKTNRKNPPTPPASKRKTRSSSKNSNKVQKLADIASNIISVVDSDPEDFEDE